MLASLLPGLRELRAPLAAGYLWLVTGWLLFHDRIDANADSLIGLDRLRDEFSAAATVAAVSFLAYVLGALWEAVIKGAVFLIAFVTETGEWGIEGRSRVRVSFEGQGLLFALGRRFLDATDDVLRVTLNENQPTHGLRGRQAFRELVWPVLDPNSPVSEEDFAERFHSESLGTARDRWWANASGLAHFVEEDHVLALQHVTLHSLYKEAGYKGVWVVPFSAAERRLIEELPLTAKRLVGEEQELYLELDRMRAEVDFRFIVALPLAVLASVLFVGLNLPFWVAVVGVLISVAAGAGLILDALRRDRERNDLIIDLLRIDKATSPTFARLLERAKAATAAGDVASDGMDSRYLQAEPTRL
jgi:hypothetical protein